MKRSYSSTFRLRPSSSFMTSLRLLTFLTHHLHNQTVVSFLQNTSTRQNHSNPFSSSVFWVSVQHLWQSVSSISSRTRSSGTNGSRISVLTLKGYPLKSPAEDLRQLLRRNLASRLALEVSFCLLYLRVLVVFCNLKIRIWLTQRMDWR